MISNHSNETCRGGPPARPVEQSSTTPARKKDGQKGRPKLTTRKNVIAQPMPPPSSDTTPQSYSTNAAYLPQYRCSHPHTDAANHQYASPAPSRPPALS